MTLYRIFLAVPIKIIYANKHFSLMYSCSISIDTEMKAFCDSVYICLNTFSSL